jgi:hypothetical protein
MIHACRTVFGLQPKMDMPYLFFLDVDPNGPPPVPSGSSEFPTNVVILGALFIIHCMIQQLQSS